MDAVAVAGVRVALLARIAVFSFPALDAGTYGLKTTICVIFPWYVQNRMPFCEYSYFFAPLPRSMTCSGSP